MSTGDQGSLAHGLVVKLGKPIVKGRWSRKTRFPTEQEICSQYGVSRSVVREAVKVLRSKGLIESRPKRGTQILERNRWNFWDSDVLNWLVKDGRFFEDLAEFRLSVEPTAASLCAQRASAKEAATIVGHSERMAETLGRREFNDYDHADVDFHQAIADACGNVLMQQMMRTLNPLISLNRAQTRPLAGKIESTVPLHQELAKAVVKRQPNKANRLMKKIIMEARDYAVRS